MRSAELSILRPSGRSERRVRAREPGAGLITESGFEWEVTTRSQAVTRARELGLLDM
jgi:hypothetical protein